MIFAFLFLSTRSNLRGQSSSNIPPLGDIAKLEGILKTSTKSGFPILQVSQSQLLKKEPRSLQGPPFCSYGSWFLVETFCKEVASVLDHVLFTEIGPSEGQQHVLHSQQGARIVALMVLTFEILTQDFTAQRLRCEGRDKNDTKNTFSTRLQCLGRFPGSSKGPGSLKVGHCFKLERLAG